MQNELLRLIQAPFRSLHVQAARMTCTLAAALLCSSAALGQAPGQEMLVTRDGVVLDYPADGVWRAKARRVVETRAFLRRAGRDDLLNAPMLFMATAPAALSGVLRVPTILVSFSDVDMSNFPFQAAQYDSLFYTTTPLRGRPYTLRTLYQEMSNGLLTIDGKSYGWVSGNNTRAYYLEACGSTLNALNCATGRSRMWELFTSALQQLDGTVDFGQFDNDGPDGIPNSGDDDGVVDVVQFILPEIGGECGGRGIWAHKHRLDGLRIGGSAYQTNDLSPSGRPIMVNPYHTVGGTGGDSCTDSTEIMGIGTAAHELGHGLGLPDLYDTGGETEGIGEWGLMGSANFRSLYSPGHLSAWSKERLGWVLVRELKSRGSYALGPVVTGDTVFLIRPKGANPRGEYFLLENKQAFGSDSANLLHPSRRAGPKLGGLLVWHIDSAKVAVAGPPFANSVNSGAIHGVRLLQADGTRDLEGRINRGDAGDPYPGLTGNNALGRATNPQAAKNHDGLFAGFALTNIRQNSDLSVAFDLSFGTVIRASDTLAVVLVDGQPYRRFHDVLDAGSAHTVSIESPQVTGDGRARFEFVSWSDGGAQTHEFVASDDLDSLVAAVDAWYLLRVQASGKGTVSSSSPRDSLAAGVFLSAGSLVRLIAAKGEGQVFDGWSGDTVTLRDTLDLVMNRPFDLVANFAPVLVVGSTSMPAGIMGARYQHQIPVTGGTGQYRWQLVSGALPKGLLWFTNGVIDGRPEETGTFNAVGRVTSGSQIAEVPITIVVNAPAVELSKVLAHLSGADKQLTEDEIRYFDLLGNRNQRFDLGDFLAWVEKTNVVPPAAPASGGKRR
ncbi:Immune inhibitor A [bacterium HR33]|nr:Immune inhibitor A [bacterium HR33]